MGGAPKEVSVGEQEAAYRLMAAATFSWLGVKSLHVGCLSVRAVGGMRCVCVQGWDRFQNGSGFLDMTGTEGERDRGKIVNKMAGGKQFFFSMWGFASLKLRSQFPHQTFYVSPFVTIYIFLASG